MSASLRQAKIPALPSLIKSFTVPATSSMEYWDRPDVDTVNQSYLSFQFLSDRFHRAADIVWMTVYSAGLSSMYLNPNLVAIFTFLYKVLTLRQTRSSLVCGP